MNKHPAASLEDPPPGYRWVARSWLKNANGTRDYAAYHRLDAFHVLEPVSARLRANSPLELMRAALRPARPVGSRQHPAGGLGAPALPIKGH